MKINKLKEYILKEIKLLKEQNIEGMPPEFNEYIQGCSQAQYFAPNYAAELLMTQLATIPGGAFGGVSDLQYQITFNNNVSGLGPVWDYLVQNQMYDTPFYQVITFIPGAASGFPGGGLYTDVDDVQVLINGPGGHTVSAPMGQCPMTSFGALGYYDAINLGFYSEQSNCPNPHPTYGCLYQPLPPGLNSNSQLTCSTVNECIDILSAAQLFNLSQNPDFIYNTIGETGIEINNSQDGGIIVTPEILQTLEFQLANVNFSFNDFYYNLPNGTQIDFASSNNNPDLQGSEQGWVHCGCFENSILYGDNTSEECLDLMNTFDFLSAPTDIDSAEDFCCRCEGAFEETNAFAATIEGMPSCECCDFIPYVSFNPESYCPKEEEQPGFFCHQEGYCYQSWGNAPFATLEECENSGCGDPGSEDDDTEDDTTIDTTIDPIRDKDVNPDPDDPDTDIPYKDPNKDKDVGPDLDDEEDEETTLDPNKDKEFTKKRYKCNFGAALGICTEDPNGNFATLQQCLNSGCEEGIYPEDGIDPMTGFPIGFGIIDPNTGLPWGETPYSSNIPLNQIDPQVKRMKELAGIKPEKK